MSLLFELGKFFPLLVFTGVIVLLVVLILQRQKEKEKENFEDRDN